MIKKRLFGTYSVSLDEKFRISVPSMWRKRISPEAEGTFVIIKGFEGSLLAMPEDEWEKYWDDIESLPENAETRTLKRIILNNMKISVMDKQGRVSFSQELCEFAEIKKELVLVGKGSKIEVWDPQALEKNIKIEEDMLSYETRLQNAADSARVQKESNMQNKKDNI